MLRKKIFKILSVLVAVIIAFSCFLLPVSAATVTGVTKLGDINLNEIGLFVSFIYPGAGWVQLSLDDSIIVEGFDGDGSLRLNCSLADTPVGTLPSDTSMDLYIYFKGNPKGLYISFPDYLVPVSEDYSLFNCNGLLSNFDFVNHLGFYFDDCSRGNNHTHYFHYCCISTAAISQFDFNLSFTNPYSVPPIEAMFNDLGSFFGSSSTWFLDIFSAITANSALFFVLLGIPIVGFVFTLTKVLKG